MIHHGQKYTLLIERKGRKGYRICEVCGIPADSIEQRFLDEMRRAADKEMELLKHTF